MIIFAICKIVVDIGFAVLQKGIVNKAKGFANDQKPPCGPAVPRYPECCASARNRDNRLVGAFPERG
jgi:hypothetical protein